ncbi:MAG TPA: serine hydrolase [Candidatus Paceibacterota bacterium]|nr:serine hydrolase [Candidatus Paceibacterota bacterium]
MQTKIYLLAIVVGLLLAVNVFFVLNVPLNEKGESLSPLEPFFNTTQAYVLPVSEPSFVPLLDSSIPKPVIDAKSALVYDVRSERFLYDFNSKQRLPIASLTKLMTALVVIDNLDLKEEVTIPKEAVRVDGSKQDLYAGEIISVEDLLQTMLIGSSNDAAKALAMYGQSKNIDFIAKMNEQASLLGMKDTQFLDPAGLNDNAYSTAQDFVKLVAHALKYNKIWEVLRQPELTLKSQGAPERQIKNTDQLLGTIDNLLGGKTGYTDIALGCMVVAVNVNNKHDTLISIVLGSTNRFEDTKKLIDWVTQAYRWE